MSCGCGKPTCKGKKKQYNARRGARARPDPTRPGRVMYGSKTQQDKIVRAIAELTEEGEPPSFSRIKDRVFDNHGTGGSISTGQLTNQLGFLKGQQRIRTEQGPNKKTPIYRVNPGRRYERKATMGRIDQPIGYYPYGIELKGITTDRNGNKIAQFKPLNGERGFSIQTNGNLPSLHGLTADQVSQLSLPEIRRAGNEILRYIGRYGTERQNRLVGQIGARQLERGGRNNAARRMRFESMTGMNRPAGYKRGQDGWERGM